MAKEFVKTVMYGGVTYNFTMAAFEVGAERLGITDETLEAFEVALIKHLSVGPPDGKAFKKMRRYAVMKTGEAAKMLGVTDVDVSEWEDMSKPVPLSAYKLMGLVARNCANGHDGLKSVLLSEAKVEGTVVDIDLT